MYKEPDTFKLVCVDPDGGSRLRLKTAALAVQFFEDILLLASVNDTLARLDTVHFDLVFLSERLAPEEITAFIQQAKKKPGTESAAFVLLMRESENNQAKAARSVLQGFDGCLMEPYSVDALVNIAKLAAEVRKQRWEAKHRAAINFLIRDIIRQVDRLAYIRQCQMNVGGVLSRLRKTCAIFNDFDENTIHYYYEMAAEQFGASKPYESVAGFKQYQGASLRVKKKMLEKIMREEIEKESSALPADDK